MKNLIVALKLSEEILNNDTAIITMGYNSFTKQFEVQLDDDYFQEIVEDEFHLTNDQVQDNKRDSKEMPHELAFEINGIKFFTVLTNTEYEKMEEWLYPSVDDEEFITSNTMTSRDYMKLAGHKLSDFS